MNLWKKKLYFLIERIIVLLIKSVIEKPLEGDFFPNPCREVVKMNNFPLIFINCEDKDNI